MAVPANNQPNPAQVQQAAPAAQVQPPAPGGVGAAPTTLQGQPPQAPAEKGYVERFSLYIKDLLVRLYQKICFCFRKPPPPPPAPPPVQAPAPAPDPGPRLREILTQLNSGDVRGEVLWEHFDEYIQNPKQRKIIFTEIGKKYGSNWTTHSYEIQGQRLAEENPIYLLPSLKGKVQSLIPAQARANP